MHGTAPDFHDPSSKHALLDCQRRKTILQDKCSDSIALEKLLHTDVITLESTLPVLKKQLFDIDSYHDVSSETSNVAMEHGLKEIKWKIIEVRDNPPVPCESIPERVFSEVPNGEENHDVVCLPTISSEQVSNSFNSVEVNLILSRISESCQSMPDHMNPHDAYKLAIGNKSKSPSPNIREVVMGRDSFRAYEEQMFAACVLETQWYNLSLSPSIINWNDLVNIINKRSSNVFPVGQEQVRQGKRDHDNHSEVEDNAFDDCGPWSFDQYVHTSAMVTSLVQMGTLLAMQRNMVIIHSRLVQLAH